MATHQRRLWDSVRVVADGPFPGCVLEGCWPALFERHTRIQWVADACVCTVCMPAQRGPHGHPPKTPLGLGTSRGRWPFSGGCIGGGVGRPCSSVTHGFSGSLTRVRVLYVCLSGVDHMATHQRRASRAAQAWQYRLHWVEWFWHTVWPQRQALALHPVADSCILYVAHDWRVCLVGSQAMSYACMRRGMLASSVWLGRLPTGAPFPTTLLRCGSV